MRKLSTKFAIVLIILVSMISQQVFCAKKTDGYEVDEPKSEPKVNKSEGIIISENSYKEYSPINPVKPGTNTNEYNSVNNYVIDFDTVETRIKHFSPTYKNIRESATSMYYMAYYARGGNDTLLYDYHSYTGEILDVASEYKSAMHAFISERNKLDKKDPDYIEKYTQLTIQIKTYETMYKMAMQTYNSTNKTISNTIAKLGLKRAVRNIENVDNNNQIAFARRAITKSIKSVILSYLQLENYTEILEKQSKLYYDIYLLNKKNLSLGLATEFEVSKSLDTYETVKKTLNATKNTYRNVKEQIAINLGYELKDIDKLVILEPNVDLTYIDSINFEDDRDRAYTSNSAYTAISISKKDKKYPGSTGEELFNKRQTYTAEKVVTEFENIYENLKAKRLLYDSSMILSQICDMNEAGNKRKLENNLIGEIEYDGLELQNLADRLQVKVAKYNLINAMNDYYYGALGHINIL